MELAVGPFVEQEPEEALGLAIGARPERSGHEVPEMRLDWP
jgi:hypothetical protein